MRGLTLASLATLGLLAACVAAPPTPTPSTPAPSPSVEPSPVGSPTPSAAVSPTPTPGPTTSAWNAGHLLKAYDFKGIGGVYFNPYLNQLYVVDAVDEKATVKRYQLRKFKPDGTYLATVGLAPDGEPAPDAVDALAFDPAGNPVYAYRDAGAFSLLKLLTSTVVAADRYPVNTSEWAGPAAISAQGVLLRVGLVNLDVERRDEARRKGVTPDMTGGKIYYGVAEEDEPPKTLFQVADPFVPTRAMAFSAQGDLYLAGQTQAGDFGLKRLKGDQTIEDVSALTARPQGMWTGRDGGVVIVVESSGTPARVSQVDAQGRLGAESELRLEGGGFLDSAKGLTYDPEGHVLVSGTGFDAANHRISGVFVF